MYVFAPYYRAIKYGEKSGPSPKNAARMTTLSPLSPTMGGMGGRGEKIGEKQKNFRRPARPCFLERAIGAFPTQTEGGGGGSDMCVMQYVPIGI